MLLKYLEMLDYDKLPEKLKKYLMTPSLLRLKNIGYFCGMDYASKNIYDFKEKISRYDHSLTVALLVWKLTSDIKQTLAGLFHDISTPCFSHVIDYMNKDYVNQESTEEKTEDILKNDTYLLKCLKEDGITVDEICDFKKYSIVDLKRPMMCSDRLDGIVLTGLFWTKSLSLEDVRKIIYSIYVCKNELGFEEIGFIDETAAQIVIDTNSLIDKFCHSKEDNYMMELLAKITKRAIDLGIVNYDELFVLEENKLMKMLEKSDETVLISDLELFKNITMPNIPDIKMPKIKVRMINPLVKEKRFYTS